MKTLLFIVGCFDEIHLGLHLKDAADQLGLRPECFDTRLASSSPYWKRQFFWRLRGRRPPKLREFSHSVAQRCKELRPQSIISTGLAPLDRQSLEEIASYGTRTLNFLTDDPFNPLHRAPWFLEALPTYDCVFSPRRANISDLEGAGCSDVRYLRFGYSPQSHFAQRETDQALPDSEAPDIVFVGGGDRDRSPYMTALAEAGLNLELYGGGWERFPRLRAHWRGFANADAARKAVTSAKIAPCLVRRANRDGHCMRTFEVPAIGTCMIVEDTEDHRELFGLEGRAVLYFNSPQELVEKSRWLLEEEEKRRNLAEKAHEVIVSGGHTYLDRLKTILQEGSGPGWIGSR